MLRRLWRNEDGGVLPFFALAVIPIVALVGAAVDYSRAASARTALQGALDAAALMLSKDAPSLTSTQLNQKATDYVAAQFNRPEAQNLVVSASYTAQPSSLVLNGSASLTSDFMGIFGKSTMPIGSTSTVAWGMTRLRVALVLDNTGSMADAGKITSLKTATKNLLTQLKSATSQNGDVYVSIIPFSKDVNVGASNYNASWVRWDLWDAANVVQGVCFFGWCWNGASWVYTGTSGIAASHNTWNGCVTDRDQDYDTMATAPSSANQATLFPAEQYGNCPAPLMALTYDWTALNQKVDDMFPNGNTNQTIGLQWGFQSLVANSPLNVPAKDPNYQYNDVVIMLTDGLNTQNRWSSTQSVIDARTAKACTNIKSAGITLYTIQVSTGSDPQSAMLQQCATDSGKFFMLTSANQMVSTFQQIGTNISKLRVAK
jgi:Flp pilus assembly protein TadG